MLVAESDWRPRNLKRSVRAAGEQLADVVTGLHAGGMVLLIRDPFELFAFTPVGAPR